MHDELPLLFVGLGEAVGPPQPSGDQPRDFGAPFDRGDSDVTIRSCDRVDFQVHKAVLGIASAAFEDMFTAPGPHGQGQVKQVIDLTENSKTLLHLLSVIYPMVPIVPDTVEDALSLLSVSKNCFRAYGIASHYRLEEEALLSAQLTLERPMTFESCGEDLQFISGADLFRLYEYRGECTEVAQDCVDKTTDQGSFRCWSKQGRYPVEELQTVPRWWAGHFLLRIADRPSPKTVTDRLAFKHVIASHRATSRCTSCMQPDDTRTGEILCMAYAAKLSEVIEQVRLDIQA
ncbi:hypothetical protein EDB92DRAFT_1522699 [Lactarius akahatsu]|uniref:BTB domain-containing protein n=1 Tax=Lactarius akahatsu TaxID=416441 RepID=A0AAD4QAN4_9AGAM|nr:hypothetical protein EDB92DRAFT_1522699 [Lactarius akahatsu]